ncbi:trypsin-like [Cochliomyia hominivorax]
MTMNIQNKSIKSICAIWVILNHILIILGKPSSFKIAGGQHIHIRDAKFVVQLVLKSNEMCGGSLVTPKYVVTAAHCVIDCNTTEILVIAGATYYDKGGVRSAVDEIHTPDYYKYSELYWDIAVLKLHTALHGSNIATIKLCNVKLYPGDHLTIYGWGKSKELDTTFRETVLQKRQQLRDVEVPVLQDSKCEHLLYEKMPDILFCAGVPHVKDACTGDSGGPAVFKNRLCGVVSIGGLCPSIGFYVNINTAKEFIKNAINSNEDID